MARRGGSRAGLALLAALAALAACAPPAPEVSVRHFASTRFYQNEHRLHVFVFDPAAERPLAERIRLARRQVAREGACRWIDAPDSVLAAETARQGAGYGGRLLAAPLDCAA